MTRENFLIFLGGLVILSPFAGLPLSWLAWVLPGLGVLVILTSMLIKHDRRSGTILEEDV